MNILRQAQASARSFRGAVLLGSALTLMAVSGQTAKADSLHGFCGTGATSSCPDNGTNSPTSQNPPTFGFSSSPGGDSGNLYLVFLLPDNVAQPSGIHVSGASTGTATLYSTTPWTSGSLEHYFGISASPNNPIGAFGAGGVTGYYTYVFGAGFFTLPGQSNVPSAPEFMSSALPIDSYIVAFLSQNTDSEVATYVATANSGAILETGSPTPPVPEPSSLMLLGTGVLGMAGVVRRRYGR